MKFAVENFKIFKQKTEFDIRPITVLVGPNGYGKSTVFEALELFSSFNLEKDSQFGDRYKSENIEKALRGFDFNKVKGRRLSTDLLSRGSDSPSFIFTFFDEKRELDLVYNSEKNQDYGNYSEFSFLVGRIVDREEPDFFGLLDTNDFNIVPLESFRANNKSITKEQYKKITAGFKQKITNLLSVYQGYNFLSTSRHINEKFTLLDTLSLKSTEIEKLLLLYSKIDFRSKIDSVHRAHIRRIVKDTNQYFSMLFNSEIRFFLKVDHENRLGSIKYTQNEKEFFLSELSFGMVSGFTICLLLALANNKVHAGLNKYIYQTNKRVYSEDGEPGWETLFLSTLALAEPEMNMHPNAQSKLADIFVTSVNNHKTTFVIETHSEYLIRRLQYLVAKKDISKDMIQIYYFNDPNNLEEGDERVYSIKINDDGSLTRPFGSGFFDEADKNSLELLLLNRTQQN